MAGGYPKTLGDYIPQISHENFSPLNYKAHIEKSYRLLPTDELRAIVNNHRAKSPYAKIFETSKAEKIEHKVAVHILKERKGLVRKI
jgi:hypothetical protein